MHDNCWAEKVDAEVAEASWVELGMPEKKLRLAPSEVEQTEKQLAPSEVEPD